LKGENSKLAMAERGDVNARTEPAKAMGGSCAGGVLGAILGVVIGGLVGQQIAQSGNDLKRNPDRTAQAYGDLLDPCMGVFGLIVGVVAGGILGAVGGSVVGVGLATTPSASRSPPLSSNSDRVGSLPHDSGTDEIAQLKARVAELEARENRDKMPSSEHQADGPQ
jgi:hypothetical protein